MSVIQDPANPLRFTLRFEPPRTGYEDYLGATERGQLGPVDTPWLTHDEWAEGRLLEAASLTDEVIWLRDRGYPFKLFQVRDIRFYPIALQLYRADHLLDFRAQFDRAA
jgi:hypothetical protein